MSSESFTEPSNLSVSLSVVQRSAVAGNSFIRRPGELSAKFLTIALLGSAADVAAVVIDGEELLDPTRPFYFQVIEDSNNPDGLELIRSVATVSFDVSFVRASNRSPLAVINEQRVTVGDVISGATVLAIDRSGVTLLIDGEERRINLYSNSVKSPAIIR